MSDLAFSHLDPLGRARMVDVTPKDPTHRRAVARCKVFMAAETTAAIANREVNKGDVLAVARVAGIQAAKRTSDVIPLCHPLLVGSVQSPDRHPDLSGMWTNYDPTPFERLGADEQFPRDLAVSTADWLVQDSPRSPRRPSMVVDPPNGRVPLRPEAIKARDAMFAQTSNSLERYGPWERCITRGVPSSMMPSAYNNGHQIIQTRDFIVFHSEMIHEARVIPLDGRPHPGPAVRSWNGDSVGRWDGDVFVVDTKNFTDNTWMSAEGRVSQHSDQLHIVERYRRVDANTLEIDATVEDPEVLTGPWTVPKQTLVLAPFDRILSLNCSGIETQALMDAAAKQTGK